MDVGREASIGQLVLALSLNHLCFSAKVGVKKLPAHAAGRGILVRSMNQPHPGQHLAAKPQPCSARMALRLACRTRRDPLLDCFNNHTHAIH
jgi:hypothetical protein